MKAAKFFLGTRQSPKTITSLWETWVWDYCSNRCHWTSTNVFRVPNPDNYKQIPYWDGYYIRSIDLSKII